jgi:hypothetical protein
MKVIDLSADQKEGSSGLLNQVSGAFKLVKPRSQELPAQERVISSLQKILNNSYVLLCQVSLEGLDVPIPLILVGPSGVHVLYASGLRGIYRANGEAWERLENQQQKFRPALPNLITRTFLMGRSVQAYLSNQGYPLAEVEPVLVFSDPGTHIDAVRPAVRIVMADAIDRFSAGLLQGRVSLGQEDVQRIVDLLAKTQGVPVDADVPIIDRDAFSFTDEEERRKGCPRPPSAQEQAIRPV